MKLTSTHDTLSEQSLNRLINSDSGISRLNYLLQTAGLEKELLNISSYESALFILDKNKINQLDQPGIDRLTLVYPPSFSFSVKYEISGYFNVKYNSAGNPLPIQVDPFVIEYSGIVILQEDHLELKNERIRMIRP
jgi:hypothetical protein